MRLEEGKDSSSDTDEEMGIIESAAMDSVEVISIMEESNMITSNASVVEEASSPNIVRKGAVRAPDSLDDCMPTPTNIPREHFIKISSTSLGRFHKTDSEKYQKSALGLQVRIFL